MVSLVIIPPWADRWPRRRRYGCFHVRRRTSAISVFRREDGIANAEMTFSVNSFILHWNRAIGE